LARIEMIAQAGVAVVADTPHDFRAGLVPLTAEQTDWIERAVNLRAKAPARKPPQLIDAVFVIECDKHAGQRTQKAVHAGLKFGVGNFDKRHAIRFRSVSARSFAAEATRTVLFRFAARD